MRDGRKLSLVVLLVLVLVTLFPSTSTAARDITEKVSVLGSTVVKENEGEISAENKIQVNDSLGLSYSLKVDQEQLIKLEAGDTFKLSLPDAAYFHVQESRLPIPLKDSVTGAAVGQASVTGSHLTVTINETGAKQKALNLLQLTLKLKALKAGSGIYAGGNDSLTVPKLEISAPNASESDLIEAEVKVAGTGNIDASRKFEYVLVDQSDKPRPVAYGVTERKLDRKGESVTIDFYKNKTGAGQLKDKIEGKTDWQTLLKDGHCYLIRDVPDPEYLATITGGIGEGNRYDYQAEQSQPIRFRILNQLVSQGQLSQNLPNIPMIAIPQMKKTEQTTPANGKEFKKQAAKGIVVKEATAPSTASSSDKKSNEEKGITLTKIDSATGEKLPGAEFELKNASGEKMYLRKKLVTDENGLLHIHPLPEGEYSLVEIKAPEGYVLDDDPITFMFTKEEKLVVLTKENAKEGAAAPVKKEFPKSSETSEGSSSQQVTTSSTTTKKHYPGTGMRKSPLLLIAGFGVLGALWLVKRKR